MKRARRVAVVLGAAALACARPGSPRGGPEDRSPPVVIETLPAPRSLVENPGTVVRFRFNERVSERLRGVTLEEAVLVSPAMGTVRVEQGRDWIEVRLQEGLRPGTVYRFTLLPVITDLFGNPMRDPFELVFSTGAEFVENAVAGQALDRITGRPVPNLMVQLLPPVAVADTLAHVARTDAAGLFFFRYIPPGSYNLVAFQDRNRNRAFDPREPFGRRGVYVQEGDTVLADVAVLEPDPTAAELVRVEVVDSITLRMVFTDYLDPESTDVASVSLAGFEGAPAPRVARVLHPTAWEALRDSARAGADQAAGRGRVPGQSETMTVPGQERGGLPRGVPLPRMELVVALDSALVVNFPYQLSAAGIVNINRIPLGRGAASVVRPPPAAQPSGERSDSAGAVPDTTRFGLVPPGSGPRRGAEREGP